MNISDYILFNQNQFIIANKPAGISSTQDLTEGLSMQEMISAYCKHDVHPITRIDRPVSGVALFAKKKSAAQLLTEQIKGRHISKVYLALVEGSVAKDEDTIIQYLSKKGNKAYLSDAESGGKKSEMSYRVIDRMDNYTLLEVKTKTGRFHQIRAQLSAIGHPIKGDVKYKARRKNKDRSIHLHAYNIELSHPVSGEKVSVTAPIPQTDGLWKAAAEIVVQKNI